MRLGRLVVDRLPKASRDWVYGRMKRFVGKKVRPDRRLLIHFVDGTSYHGGMVDRFKGMVSMFHYCLCNNIPFKIHHVFPFSLGDYLLPNEYDWQLSDSDRVSYHPSEAVYLNLVGDPTVRRLVSLRTKKQVHVIANRDLVAALNSEYKTNFAWGELFGKLFRPTDELSRALAECRRHIGGDYACAVFRFQNLLGDFDEYGSEELPPFQKADLIDKCRQALIQLQGTAACRRFLVTSDSVRFLDEVTGLRDVYAFPAKVVHADNPDRASHDVYLKSFLDFYLLSEGQEIYSLATDQMYKSGFPNYAAKLRNVRFERVAIP